MNIAIIGGGLSGLALALEAGKGGHKVKIFEQAPQIGGLATWQDHGPFVFDRYYHVILPTDKNLISFIDEIGLSDQLRWNRTYTGFFVDEKIYSVSDAFEFLKFKPLSLVSKMRLAYTILYCSRINDWRRLEKITVEEFLVRLSGRKTYEKLWKPLLLAKLGEHYKRVSAVFIWTYIKRMFSARDKSASKESMGHVVGGYKTVFDRVSEILHSRGAELEHGVAVTNIVRDEAGRLCVGTARGSEVFDKVVFTGPVNILQKVAGEELIKVEDSGKNVEYLGVQCMALVTKRPLTEFYILNIADDRIPFTGVVGMSTIVDTKETAGHYLTYLPKYILSTDPAMDEPEEKLQKEFLQGLRLIYPDLAEDDIVSCQIHRARKVQPLQVLGYSELIPKAETRDPDFFVMNTAQFVNNTLNNNEVIGAVRRFVQQHGKDLFDRPPIVAA